MGDLEDVLAGIQLPVYDAETQARVDAEREQAEREQRAMERRLRLKESGIAVTGEDLGRLVADQLEDTIALRKVRAWHEVASGRRPSRSGRPMRFLALLGPMGTGKTVAAAYVIAERGGMYVTADEVRRAYVSEHEQARDARRRLEAIGVVVVDDVGTERNADDTRHALYELVNRRQRGRQATILTGNMTRQDFTTRYDARMLDRIEHQGAIVEITGESLRRRP